MSKVVHRFESLFALVSAQQTAKRSSIDGTYEVSAWTITLPFLIFQYTDSQMPQRLLLWLDRTLGLPKVMSILEADLLSITIKLDGGVHDPKISSHGLRVVSVGAWRLECVDGVLQCFCVANDIVRQHDSWILS